MRRNGRKFNERWKENRMKIREIVGIEFFNILHVFIKLKFRQIFVFQFWDEMKIWALCCLIVEFPKPDWWELKIEREFSNALSCFPVYRGFYMENSANERRVGFCLLFYSSLPVGFTRLQKKALKKPKQCVNCAFSIRFLCSRIFIHARHPPRQRVHQTRERGETWVLPHCETHDKTMRKPWKHVFSVGNAQNLTGSQVFLRALHANQVRRKVQLYVWRAGELNYRCSEQVHKRTMKVQIRANDYCMVADEVSMFMYLCSKKCNSTWKLHSFLIPPMSTVSSFCCSQT